MGSLQKYFSYSMGLICGIPSVTRLGEKEDEVEIEQRLDKLQILGDEAKQFSDMLRSMLRYFLMSFEEPAAPAVKDFWGKIAHHQSGSSGPTYLSGWITAFCFWDEKGQSLVRLPDRNGCDLNGVLYHRVVTAQIPSGYVSAGQSERQRKGSPHEDASWLREHPGLTSTFHWHAFTQAERYQYWSRDSRSNSWEHPA